MLDIKFLRENPDIVKKNIQNKFQDSKLPLVDEGNHLKGLITIKDIEKAVRYPNSARDSKGRLLCGAAIGVTNNMMERVDALIEAQADVLSLDSAHGHSKNIIDAVKNPGFTNTL